MTRAITNTTFRINMLRLFKWLFQKAKTHIKMKAKRKKKTQNSRYSRKFKISKETTTFSSCGLVFYIILTF